MTPSDLRRLRRRLGLSQAGFAALVGVTSNTVARWERGELGMRPTTIRLLEMIAAAPQRPKKKASSGGRRR
jgi:DNA-binding transcriptional regulator YiaG